MTTFIGAVYLTITTPIFSESARDRLFDAPLVYLFVLIPLLGALLIFLLLRSLYLSQEKRPFIWTLLLFFLSFIGLGSVVFPYIIPNKITIYEAAASPSSLVFMIVFIGFLIPIMLAYNIYNYIVFRGKIVSSTVENEG